MNTLFKRGNCDVAVDGIEYKDGYLTIEQHYECPHCGYRRHWAYGNIMPDDSDYEEEKVVGINMSESQIKEGVKDEVSKYREIHN